MLRLTVLAAAWCLSLPVFAQQPAPWPTKPLTLVHPQATGGPVDITTRLVASKAAEALGQTILVEARPGAGGSLSATYVKQAAPDGYTLLLGTHQSLAINVELMPKLAYDPVKHFAPVTLLWTNPTLMIVGAGHPARNLGELVAIAQKQPDKVSYATAGIGTTGHLAGHMLATQAMTTMVHIPYKGSVDAMNDILAGRVDAYLGSFASFASYYKAGKVRVVAAVSRKRNSMVPDVPTMPELGYPDIYFESWFGVVAPVGTSRPIIQRLHQEFTRAVSGPEVEAKLLAQGTLTLTSATPEEFGAFIASEIPRLGRSARLSGAQPD